MTHKMTIWQLRWLDDKWNDFTPLLSWPINKNFDPRTGILHIVRDPQGIPKIPLTRSESSIWGRYSPLKKPFLQRPLQTSDWAANSGNGFVAKFWCVLKKKVPKSDHYFLSYWWAPIIRNGPVDPDNQQVVNSAKFLFMGPINNSGNNGWILELFF